MLLDWIEKMTKEIEKEFFDESQLEHLTKLGYIPFIELSKNKAGPVIIRHGEIKRLHFDLWEPTLPNENYPRHYFIYEIYGASFAEGNVNRGIKEANKLKKINNFLKQII